MTLIYSGDSFIIFPTSQTLSTVWTLLVLQTLFHFSRDETSVSMFRTGENIVFSPGFAQLTSLQSLGWFFNVSISFFFFNFKNILNFNGDYKNCLIYLTINNIIFYLRTKSFLTVLSPSRQILITQTFHILPTTASPTLQIIYKTFAFIASM